MITSENIKKTIADSVNEARCHTDTLYYNLSYLEAIKAGSILKKDPLNQAAIVTISSTLLAWNQGTAHASNMSSLFEVEETNLNYSFKNLIAKVIEVEKNGIINGNNRKLIFDVLALAQNSLSMSGNAVVMPSKLIHFLSPQYFSIVDSRIDSALKGNVTTKNGYGVYMQSLWDLGFHLKKPSHITLTKYWKHCELVSPMRVIDCTLYTIGKNITIGSTKTN